MSKRESLEHQHIQFLERVRGLLNDFGITTSEVVKRIYPPPENPSYYFLIHNRAENLIKFFGNIPLEFFANKQRGGEEVTEAFKYHIKRAELYRKALALKAEGKKNSEISRELKIHPRTVCTWIKGESKPILANHYPKKIENE